MNRSFDSYPNAGFFRRLLGNLLPVVFVALGLTVLIFMSNTGCGDRPQDFQAAGITLVVGLLVATIVSVFVKGGERTAKMQHGMRVAIRFFLAYTFMTYGAAKVIDMQFAGSLMMLDARIIDMTPMQVAWTFFGYTFTYQAIIGGSQIAAAVLLCFRRTTTVGAILLLTVIGNIVMVNVFYDICVKLNSSIYLAMTLYLLLVDFNRLWAFFIANRPVPARRYPVMTHNQSKHQILLLLGGLVTLFVLLYPFYETIQAKKQYKVGEKSALYGVWAVNQITPILAASDSLAVAAQDSLALAFPDSVALSGQESTEAWGAQWEKLFFDRANTGAAKGPDRMDYFSYAVDSTQRTLSMTFFRDSTLNFTGSYVRPTPERLVLLGVHEQDSVEVALTVMAEFFRERR